jgi:hypothetical protein
MLDLFRQDDYILDAYIQEGIRREIPRLFLFWIIARQLGRREAPNVSFLDRRHCRAFAL